MLFSARLFYQNVYLLFPLLFPLQYEFGWSDFVCYVFGNCLFHKNAEFWYVMSECERCFSYIDLFEAFFGANVFVCEDPKEFWHDSLNLCSWATSGILRLENETTWQTSEGNLKLKYKFWESTESRSKCHLVLSTSVNRFYASLYIKAYIM